MAATERWSSPFGRLGLYFKSHARQVRPLKTCVFLSAGSPRGLKGNQPLGSDCSFPLGNTQVLSAVFFFRPVLGDLFCFSSPCMNCPQNGALKKKACESRRLPSGNQAHQHRKGHQLQPLHNLLTLGRCRRPELHGFLHCGWVLSAQGGCLLGNEGMTNMHQQVCRLIWKAPPLPKPQAPANTLPSFLGPKNGDQWTPLDQIAPGRGGREVKLNSHESDGSHLFGHWDTFNLAGLL